ncbi:uncharacterized protein LOC110108708 isoform X2 [Dendrobium catenatum]|uniref:uncharacterized protein LOC110108708 isoform X2 n=1 Tax=Dendrobium catenatum TaxID=906689 RepID=UPI0009F1AE87|nr:uncharacterized protein LOC110108708 isoform X2 [Dendrobium catenatum]
MARKGNQPRNGFDRKTNKLQNVIPRSLDPSFVESKEKKGKSDQNFTSCDHSNGDFPSRSSNPFPEQAINTESTGTVRSCKQRISDVHLREKSGIRTQSSARAGVSIEVVDIAEHDLLSDASKLTETNELMLDHNSYLSKNIFGSSSVRSALDFVGSLDAISGWSFRSASYVLKLASGWIEHQKPRVSPFISYMHSIYDFGIARIKFVYPVICTWILHLGKLILFLSAIWLDYSIRGLTSLLHLGTASLFTVLWCSLLSIVGMVGFIKLLIMVVIAVMLLIFIGIAPAILVLAISATVVLWFYGSFWTTSLVTLMGGASFGLHHERIALFVTMLYSLHCARSYMGWLGLLLGLNLSFISSDVLIHVLKNNANENRGSADFSHEIPSTSGRETELTSEDEVARLLNSCDHYTALGFNRFENVDVSVLKKEYKKRAMLVHPDKNRGNEKAVEAFKKLQNAYEVLLDSIKRKNYDDDLRREELLNYIRSFQTSSHKDERHGILSFESTHIDAEDRGSYGESRRIFCKKCGTFHIWNPIERSKSQARWCQDCKDFHQAKDGDGWLEQSNVPFLFGLLQKVEAPRAYICAESRIYNATQWVICQGIKAPANTHKPSFHVNISLNSKYNGNSKASGSSHRESGSMPSPNMAGSMTEEDLYEWLQNAMNSGRFEPDFTHKEGPSSSSCDLKSSSKKKRKGKRQW